MIPFVCACRGADPVPDIGPSASNETNSLASRLLPGAPGAFWETGAVLVPTGLARGSFVLHFNRSSSLGSSPLRLGEDFALQVS